MCIIISYFVGKFVIFFTQYCFQGVVFNVCNISTFHIVVGNVWLSGLQGVVFYNSRFVLLVHKVFISFIGRIFLIGLSFFYTILFSRCGVQCV